MRFHFEQYCTTLVVSIINIPFNWIFLLLFDVQSAVSSKEGYFWINLILYSIQLYWCCPFLSELWKNYVTKELVWNFWILYVSIRHAISNFDDLPPWTYTSQITLNVRSRDMNLNHIGANFHPLRVKLSLYKVKRAAKVQLIYCPSPKQTSFKLEL